MRSSSPSSSTARRPPSGRRPHGADHPGDIFPLACGLPGVWLAAGPLILAEDPPGPQLTDVAGRSGGRTVSRRQWRPTFPPKHSWEKGSVSRWETSLSSPLSKS